MSQQQQYHTAVMAGACHQEHVLWQLPACIFTLGPHNASVAGAEGETTATPPGSSDLWCPHSQQYKSQQYGSKPNRGRPAALPPTAPVWYLLGHTQHQ